jgi:hypothetical protein
MQKVVVQEETMIEQKVNQQDAVSLHSQRRGRRSGGKAPVCSLLFQFIEKGLYYGFSHHQVVVTGDQRKRYRAHT